MMTVRKHWPEYAIEAWALGMFMLSAAAFAVLIESPGSPVRAMIVDPLLRQALGGIAMGTTAIALIYSPWGRRSGAHMNPAVTLTFLRLGKIARIDAAFFIVAQFIGGLIGVAVAFALLGQRLAGPPINFVATLPGPSGVASAFALEALISCALMGTVLWFSSSKRLMPYTGIAAGTLVALYITFESPFSGMSMNPARSFASAAAAGEWRDLWIYFTAPPLGMWAASLLYTEVGRRTVGCAKLHHAADQRCIHCGYVPPQSRRLLHENRFIDNGV